MWECGNLSQGQVNALNTLRKDVLFGLDDNIWNIVVTEVVKAGAIQNTTGTTRKIIEDAIEKAQFGDRSAAGRYAAEQRWKGHSKVKDIRQIQRQTGQPVTSAKDALQVQSAGGNVSVALNKVHTLLTELANFAHEAKKSDKDPPDLDLCKVSVPGTNLFCGDSLGIPRIEMPQLSGIPKAGSEGDKMPKDKRGRINIGEAFIQELAKTGVSVREGTVTASRLKASQKELIGADVAGIMKAIEKGTMNEDAIFVSRDGYVIDGHHRWAAKVGADLADGDTGDVKMKVRVIDMDIRDVLNAANGFADKMGMPRRSGNAKEDSKTAEPSAADAIPKSSKSKKGKK